MTTETNDIFKCSKCGGYLQPCGTALFCPNCAANGTGSPISNEIKHKMTIETLCDKYPALCILRNHAELLVCLEDRHIMTMKRHKDEFYKDFKSNIFCIGLEPEEYEFCIRWFCEVMEY